MTDHTWLNQYPDAKALLQQDDDELVYTPRHVGLPEDDEDAPGRVGEIREWVEQDI
jgi:hypothetical protein